MILGAAFRLFRNLNSNQEDTVAVLVGRNPAIVSGRRCSGLVSQDTATVYVPVTGRHILLLGEPNLFIYVDISTYAHPISNTMHLCHHACKKTAIYVVPHLFCRRPMSLLQPYLPSRISIAAVSIVPYLLCRSYPPPSLPAFFLFHTHHPAYLPPLVSSSSCISYKVLITPFSIFPVLFSQNLSPTVLCFCRASNTAVFYTLYCSLGLDRLGLAQFGLSQSFLIYSFYSGPFNFS